MGKNATADGRRWTQMGSEKGQPPMNTDEHRWEVGTNTQGSPRWQGEGQPGEERVAFSDQPSGVGAVREPPETRASNRQRGVGRFPNRPYIWYSGNGGAGVPACAAGQARRPAPPGF